jgi:hypothetical protein
VTPWISECCFINYHQKSRKEKCPTCQQTIVTYVATNTQTNTTSASFDFKELLASQTKGDLTSTENPFECLDHAYFVEEISKLISIRNEIELDRFHRRMINRDPSMQKNLDLQWTAIKQIELRLFDI